MLEHERNEGNYDATDVSRYERWKLKNAESLAAGWIFGLEPDQIYQFKEGRLESEFNLFCEEEYREWLEGKHSDDYVGGDA